MNYTGMVEGPVGRAMATGRGEGGGGGGKEVRWGGGGGENIVIWQGLRKETTSHGRSTIDDASPSTHFSSFPSFCTAPLSSLAPYLCVILIS